MSMRNRKRINEYTIHMTKQVGQGSYAKVYLATHDSSEEILAVKIINRKQIEQDQYTTNAIREEMAIHQRLHHQNIVKVIEIVSTPNNYYVFQQFCQGGSLRDLLKQKKRLDQAIAVEAIKQICSAFETLYEQGIVHRDLKPENIVIKDNVLKIIDFGFAKNLLHRRQLTSTVLGSVMYMAPQILKKNRYSSKCDVWSVGCIFYELLTGVQPWGFNNFNERLKIIQSNKIEFPEEVMISQRSKDFIKGCLGFQEEERFSWLQVFEHDIWQGYFKKVVERWREGYRWAEQVLDRIKQQSTMQVIVGIFLQTEVASLGFQQFWDVMNALLGRRLSNREASMLYEQFDKDQNGVIDLQQFGGRLSDCPQEILSVLNMLLNNGHCYRTLIVGEKFKELCEKVGVREGVIVQSAYHLLCNMEGIK